MRNRVCTKIKFRKILMGYVFFEVALGVVQDLRHTKGRYRARVWQERLFVVPFIARVI
jgi:hypothetical protein